MTWKLPLVYVLLADVDAVLQAQGNHRLINDASKVCTTFYEKKLVQKKAFQGGQRISPISYGVTEPVPEPEKLTP
jgi:hypothetical protein